MRKKGILKAFLLIVALFIFSSCAVSAESDYGQDEIYDALPDAVQESFSQEDVTDGQALLEITPESVFNWLGNIIKNEAQRPLALLLSLMGLVLLCALAENVRDTAGKTKLTQVFSVVAILVGAAIMCGFISESIETVRMASDGYSSFLLTFIPAFAGIIAVNGQAATAAAYNVLIIGASECIAQSVSAFLLPAVSCILGISAAGAINPDLQIHNIAETAKKAVNWILGAMMAVFTGLLSVQSFIAAAGDSVALKTAKFTVSSAVPIVGGAVADALGTVKSSITLLRSSVGSFGIIAALAIIVPALLSTILCRFAFTCGASISELFGIKSLTSLIKCGESIMAIMNAVLICLAVLVIVSTALMLAIGGYGA